jgi:hypothetical protein
MHQHLGSNRSEPAEKLNVWKKRSFACKDEALGKTLDLPARSRFGEGRAAPLALEPNKHQY